MKKILTTVLFFTALLLIACNSAPEKKQQTDMAKVHQKAIHDTSIARQNIKEVSPSFTNTDAKAIAAFKVMVDKYLDLKNALANNDEGEAKKKGKELFEAISKVDISLLNDEQRKVYMQEEEDLKENAEHIGKSEIEHQRMHFSILSQGIYAIVKAFGGGRSLYHIYCSKAENGEGAMWLSDAIDSKDPYNVKDTSCFNIIEKIK